MLLYLADCNRFWEGGQLLSLESGTCSSVKDQPRTI